MWSVPTNPVTAPLSFIHYNQWELNTDMYDISIRQTLSPYADDCQATGNSTNTVNNLGVNHPGLLNMNERGKAEHKLLRLLPPAMAKQG